MRSNRDLSFVNERLTTVQIFYYMPDYIHLIQEFTWQFNDNPPIFTRTHRFLNYWRVNIEAVIKDIYLANAVLSKNEFINAKDIFKL